ncbi:hypothetical protein [Acidithiobacillus marinus]|uniref:hypothetical protein n=1 Tax=Acidithiobacillus marinus TaxID=187490 RepID=UPI0015566D0A|nr:hypothetical protein [Acidithiobacillus marinus]
MTKTKIIIHLDAPPSITSIIAIQKKLKQLATQAVSMLVQMIMAFLTLHTAFLMAGNPHQIAKGILFIAMAATLYTLLKAKINSHESDIDKDIRMLDYVCVEEKTRRTWFAKSYEARQYMSRVRHTGRPLTRLEADMLGRLCELPATDLLPINAERESHGN